MTASAGARHQIERFAWSAGKRRSDGLKLRELQSLQNAISRQVQEMKSAREQKADML
ncbi:hypothetical protein [Bradyrhizobium macuxiense]|uniref:hypothetical protein n=1 Tax=Bradyrhizobium macuxiense TaxID=1755647 RepID=UPI00142E93BF|nr:hypothetical protein [Bradyrhizobium macuxiense]